MAGLFSMERECRRGADGAGAHARGWAMTENRLSREDREGGEVRRTGIFVDSQFQNSQSSVRSGIMVAVARLCRSYGAGAHARGRARTEIRLVAHSALRICHSAPERLFSGIRFGMDEWRLE